jgi:hypothetical protein
MYNRRMLTGIIPGKPTIIGTFDPRMDVASPSTSSSTCEFDLKMDYSFTHGHIKKYSALPVCWLTCPITRGHTVGSSPLYVK